MKNITAEEATILCQDLQKIFDADFEKLRKIALERGAEDIMIASSFVKDGYAHIVHVIFNPPEKPGFISKLFGKKDQS
jgi:hypothetical protein